MPTASVVFPEMSVQKRTTRSIVVESAKPVVRLPEKFHVYWFIEKLKNVSALVGHDQNPKQLVFQVQATMVPVEHLAYPTAEVPLVAVGLILAICIHPRYDLTLIYTFALPHTKNQEQRARMQQSHHYKHRCV